MGSNHMHDQFRHQYGKKKDKEDMSEPQFEIPQYDPQTGEANPYYEELTGEKLPQYDTEKAAVFPETDLDKLNRFLITVAESEVGIRRKVLMIKKFLDILGEKED